MTSENNKLLSSVKEQVEQMFETIHKLESEKKNEAIGYLRKCLDGDASNLSVSNASEKPECSKNEAKMTETLSTSERQTRRQSHKVKFKNHARSVKKAVLKCRICGLLNKTKTRLLKHVETHIGTPISCKLCKTDFNNRSSYLCHISLKICKINKSVKKYYCDQCQKIFKYKRQFEKHMEGHNRNNCTYCDVRLTRRKQLIQHLLTTHSIKLERTVMFKCEYCEKRYVKKRSLYHHLKQHADNKIVCMECGWMSFTKEGHLKHFKEHEKDRPWQCEKCDERFTRRQQYLYHIKRHDRYKCETCNETFASKIRVLRHRQRGHSVLGLEPQMKCPHCPMAFQRRLLLQIHMKKHLDDKVAYCKYCDKNFRTPYAYFKHCTTTVHDTKTPEKQQLVCEICGKLFAKKYQLEQHLHRVHNLKKQMYTCEYCGHKTSNRKNMDRHMSLHLEDKKEIICDQCGKAFYNITTLKDHVSYVHSQERIFKCDQCDKAFKRNSELVRHKTSHSELRPHVCQTCGVSYKRSTHLRRHEESRHGTTTKNRRVQRLTKDKDGTLVPISVEKKNKTINKKKNASVSISKQVFSIMDAASGEMVTFALPDTSNDANSLTTVLGINNQTFNQDIIQAVELPYQQTNLILNPTDNVILTNNLSDPSLNLVTNYSNQLLNSGNYSNTQTQNTFVSPGILQAPTQIQNSTTCDILLPENRILDLQSQQNAGTGYSQNPYQFL